MADIVKLSEEWQEDLAIRETSQHGLNTEYRLMWMDGGLIHSSSMLVSDFIKETSRIDVVADVWRRLNDARWDGMAA